MDETQDMKAADALVEETTPDAEEDDVIQTLPQGAMLGGDHGKEKVAVIRRNVAGRKKPTRQGLRDSLLKSLDESDLQNILADVSLEEGDEPDSSERQHADVAPAHADPTPARAEVNNPLLANLNEDLNSVLRRRQSGKGDSGKGSEATGRRARPVTMPDVSTENEESTADLTAMRHSTPLPPIDRTTKPKVLNSTPELVPRRLPSLVPKAHNHTDMVTSPEPSQPITSHADANVESSPLAVKLKKVEARPIAADKTDDVTRAPWTSKLRKVELPPHGSETNERPLILPPKPKLRPVSLIQPSVAEQKADNSNNIFIEEQSVSVSSLPTKTVKSPVSESSVHKQLTPSGERDSQPSQDINRARPLKSASEAPVMRRSQATTNSQPDWIRQAAEKRKRASMLIEQAEAAKNSPKMEEDTESGDGNDVPLVQLRFPKKVSRSSSIESNSTTSSQQSDTPVPRWKRELNQQNAQRRVDRHRKVQSCIEQTTPSVDTEKENREDNSIPAWKKQLKSSRAPVVETRTEEKVGAEPEFIKMFKKRQDRLRKCGSQLIEME